MGIAGDDTLKYQAINSVIALVAQFCCIMLIDKTGRRWPMIGGNIGNMITFIIATILLAKYPPGTANNKSAAWGFIIMTWLYNFSFSATNGPLSWIIPAEVFDTRTRSKGVSIGCMVSFAFNTMIGQVTSIAMADVGYKFYYLFIVSHPVHLVLIPIPIYPTIKTQGLTFVQICNFTNAIFFWAVLPETAKRPLEEMNYLFTNAPWFVPGMSRTDYRTHELEHKVEEIETKQGIAHHREVSV